MVPQIEALTQALERVQQIQPVVHAITNWVTAGDVANVLNAVGARPVLAFAMEEVTEIVAKADALMLNLGTPTPERVNAMIMAGRHANTLGKPLILDPVGAGASGFRKEAVRRILAELRVSVIKGNQAEVGALAGMGGELRGVEAVRGPGDLLAAAGGLSRQTGAIIAVTGKHDLVVGRGQTVTVENGHPLMGKMTGTGCMLAAVIAAFTAVEKDSMTATVAALTCFGLAGERAGERASGPGTFKAALIDSLFMLRPADLRAGAKIRG